MNLCFASFRVNTSIYEKRDNDGTDFAVCTGEEKTQWTNFHFVMCIGIVGFFVFWLVLLAKMYLPKDFTFWPQGSDDVEETNDISSNFTVNTTTTWPDVKDLS